MLKSIDNPRNICTGTYVCNFSTIKRNLFYLVPTVRLTNIYTTNTFEN